MSENNEQGVLKLFEQGLDALIPHITYRLYKAEGGVVIVPILNEDESIFDATRFVSKIFYTQAGIELALLGYKLLDGEWLTFEDRVKLARLLR